MIVDEAKKNEKGGCKEILLLITDASIFLAL